MTEPSTRLPRPLPSSLDGNAVPTFFPLGSGQPYFVAQPCFTAFPFFIVLCLILVISLPNKGHAIPPKRFEIQTFSLAFNESMLAIDLSLALDNEEGLYSILKDGAVVELGIDLEIERKREWWSNASVASLRYASVIRHDPLTREFYLTMPGVAQPLKDRNLTRLLANSWQKLSLPLIPQSLIELEGRNKTYVISCTASLNHIETPPWLAQNSVFWSAEIIPPVTISLEYVYQ